ncbi:protein ASPARTIC PROTEASE IN GUARD CELL 1-like [Solanum dulcamara]|uniref:protein ASPARTIC PROTEASE IN GUARD CELL 1-like n=1 Tax=Solanum dulcamara TaxID=45834 RepID=UPI002485E2A8|nr:protein ASPARTIC PROTEASE IN GUARD CELL 1-like [Solanum dulcamara]
MAQFRLFLLFISLVSVPCVLSRSLSSSSHPHSQIFDVAASIEKIVQLLSPTTQNFQQEAIKNTHSNSSSISVSIYPRSALVKPRHKDYAALTLSRLERDSARVSSLTMKLQLALNNFNHSDLKPVQTMLQPEDLQTPITSGASQGSGEYFTRLGLGQPAKEFYMVLDTGSDITWVQCEPCSDCYQQSDPIFNPSSSSTYSQLSCNAAQCSALQVSACGSQSCLYQVSYGDGSFTVGEFATETVSFGNSGSFPKVAIGCGHDNEGLFVGAAGLIALGRGSLSLPTQIKASSFSYCFVDRDSASSSTLDFNSARPGDSVIAPLLRNSRRSTFFYVGLTGISVGGEMLSIPASVFQIDGSGNGGIIVDSGTAVTRLQSSAYNALRDSFVKYTQHLPSAGKFALFDTCYDLSSMRRTSVPTLAFHFSGGKTLSLHPKNYLIPVDSSGKFCLAFAPTEGSLSIIGNIQQQGTRVSYDLANNLVGFSPDKC